MNQRSISSRPSQSGTSGDSSFTQKVSKAIWQKKQFIANLAHGKGSTHQAMNYRLSPFNRPRQHLKTQQTFISKQATKTVYISQQMMQSYLRENLIDSGICVNHPSKRAVFEQKMERTGKYCHECAIKEVKNNTKVVGISNQSLMLRHLIDRQLEKIGQEEIKIKRIIEQYYQEVRENFQKVYREFLDKRMHQTQLVDFAAFGTENCNIDKVKDCLGKIQPVKFKFISLEEKQNLLLTQNMKKQSFQCQNISQKQLTVNDIALQSNRSQQSKSQRGTRTIRSRENSNYRKGTYNQSRKMLNLR